MKHQDDTNQTSTCLLDDFLEKEGIVAILRQRVNHLEQFRTEYLQNSPAAAPADSTNSAEQATTIITLEKKIQELEGCQSILESELERLSADNDELRAQSTPVQSTPVQESPIAPQSDASTESDIIIQLKEEVTQAVDMAFGAMRSNADLGSIIDLLTRSFECDSIAALGTLVISSIKNYGLEGVVCFAHTDQHEFYATIEEASPTHQERIINIDTTEPLTESDNDIMLYTKHCQFLIWGIDKQDFKAFNDQKDTLSMLAIGVNAGTKRVIFANIAAKERENLEKLVKTTQKNLQHIEAKQQQEVETISAMAHQTTTGFAEQLALLTSDEQQKTALTQYITQELDNIQKTVKNTAFVDTNFKKVISALTISLAKPSDAKRNAD